MKIAVLLGGSSSEREISLASGLAVLKALREAGHEAHAIDTARGFISPENEAELLPEGVHSDPPEQGDDAHLPPSELGTVPQLLDADVAFMALHGGAGEDGTVQALLDLLGVPYTGSGVLGSAIAMDKDTSKRLLRDAEIPTLPWRTIRAPHFHYDPEAIREFVGYPCVVKPSAEGSSVGLHVVESEEQFAQIIAQERERYDEILVESFAKGRELTVSVLGDETFPPVEIRPKGGGLYDYKAKYTSGQTEYLCPAPLDVETTAELKAFALRAFRVLKLRDYARIDFILSRERLFCLEANTLPGMTATSLLPKAAKAAGVEFVELCDRIARSANRR